MRTSRLNLFVSMILLAAALLQVSAAAAPAVNTAPPAQAYISGLVGHRQTYALSCESRSAADLAGYWGLSINEVDFFNHLPASDNPDRGFVGSVHGVWGNIPPNAYGVHAKPVARLLNDYGLDADWIRGMSWKALRNEIAAGRPVIVWIIGGVWAGTPVKYTSSDGHETIVAAYEHTMILVGYDENYVYLVDAGSGGQQTHSVSNFLASWGVLGNMAVTAQGVPSSNNQQTNTQTSSNDDSSGTASGGTYVVQAGDYLTKLAEKWGMSWTQLAALNGISYPYVIHPGQLLKTNGNNTTASNSNNNTNNDKQDDKDTQSSDPAPQASGKTYTVKAGDYLVAIARKLELNWVAIAELNGIRAPYTLYAGQVLKLPGKDAGPPPEPLSSDSGDSGNNSNNNSSSGETYTVQRGDYLVALSRTFGVDWRTLASINGIGYPYIVYPGQVLKIP